MRQRSHIIFGLRVIIFAIVAILAALVNSAHCESAEPAPSTLPEGVSLIIQQVPAQGGCLTPEPGIYHFKADSEITLTAVPRPGFKFICWMGGVNNPTASSTVTCINEPKIIVAVFERTEYSNSFSQGGGSGGGGGGDQLIARGVDVGNYAQLMAGGGKIDKPKLLSGLDTDSLKPEPPVFIVPVSDEVTTPEPATAILLALGGLFTFVRCRTKRHIS